MTQVSVILPVYNAEQYIVAAITSILEQTLTDFELIVINDGSTDSSLELLAELASNDSRIVLISRENKGLIFTLNEAISLAKSDFIARMDADDISLPERLEKQLTYLKKHPDVAVLGTGYRYMNEQGVIGNKRHVFTKYDDIKASFFFGNPIAHPSVMVNAKLLGDVFKYDSQYHTIEDFALWHFISQQFKIENLSQVLLHYRVLEQSISGKNLQIQLASAVKLLANSAPFNEEKNAETILSSIYSYSVNSTSYIQFIKSCLKLNFINLTKQTVHPIALLKRTLIALALWRRKTLRK